MHKFKRPRLGVNVDHIATLRQARGTIYPDPVMAAALAEDAGADQITVHLREDRRHIQERDVRVLRSTVQTVLNLEMAATQAMLHVALDIKPDTVTLVPERREELTTEGGLHVIEHAAELERVVMALKQANIAVSAFIDPVLEQVAVSRELGFDIVELHTGTYCETKHASSLNFEFARLQEAAAYAHNMGMVVAAGHGLHYHNIQSLLSIREIEEYNIGHSIVARASLVGFERAVRDMLALLEAGRVCV